MWPESRWIGKGRQVSAPRDLLHVYDVVAASGACGIFVGIAVSTKDAGFVRRERGKFPLGAPAPQKRPYATPPGDGEPDDLLKSPSGWPSGLYEVYVHYRTTATSGARKVPRRTWWILSEWLDGAPARAIDGAEVDARLAAGGA